MFQDVQTSSNLGMLNAGVGYTLTLDSESEFVSLRLAAQTVASYFKFPPIEIKKGDDSEPVLQYV